MLPVTYLPPAEKYFKKLREKPLKKLYREAIIAIRQNPNIGEMKTGDLTGILCYDVKYQGINHEIAYRVEENENGELVVVIMAGTRENFYDALKTYLYGR